MNKKIQLPDEFLDAVAGGILVVDGKDVTDYTVSEEGGQTTFTLSTTDGDYALTTKSGGFQEMVAKSMCKKGHLDPKDRYKMDNLGFKPVE